MTSHLTDESFAELLAGEASIETAAHLETCEPCRREAQELLGAVEAFKSQSLAWAEARVEGQAAPTAAGRRGALLAFPRRMQAAAALLLACAAVGGAYRSFDHVNHAPAAHAHPAGSLAQDNQLLLSIDQELSAQEPPPGTAYAKTAAQGTDGATVRD